MDINEIPFMTITNFRALIFFGYDEGRGNRLI